jgi:hypothetical protein
MSNSLESSCPLALLRAITPEQAGHAKSCDLWIGKEVGATEFERRDRLPAVIDILERRRELAGESAKVVFEIIRRSAG